MAKDTRLWEESLRVLVLLLALREAAKRGPSEGTLTHLMHSLTRPYPGAHRGVAKGRLSAREGKQAV